MKPKTEVSFLAASLVLLLATFVMCSVTLILVSVETRQVSPQEVLDRLDEIEQAHMSFVKEHRAIKDERIFTP